MMITTAPTNQTMLFTCLASESIQRLYNDHYLQRVYSLSLQGGGLLERPVTIRNGDHATHQ